MKVICHERNSCTVVFIYTYFTVLYGKNMPPKGYKTVTLKEDVYKLLLTIADRLELSFSDALRAVLEYYVKQRGDCFPRLTPQELNKLYKELGLRKITDYYEDYERPIAPMRGVRR